MLSPARPSSAAAAAVYALAVAAAVLGDCSPSSARYCAGTAGGAARNSTYVCGDARLGPVVLPGTPPTGSLVAIYDRFGGLCPGQFLATYYDASAKSWVYPPDGGFQLDTAGDPIAAAMTLPVGLLIDRFGSEYGLYASPAAAPYMQRALPPSNLDTPAGNPAYVFWTPFFGLLFSYCSPLTLQLPVQLPSVPCHRCVRGHRRPHCALVWPARPGRAVQAQRQHHGADRRRLPRAGQPDRPRLVDLGGSVFRIAVDTEVVVQIVLDALLAPLLFLFRLCCLLSHYQVSSASLSSLSYF